MRAGAGQGVDQACYCDARFGFATAVGFDLVEKMVTTECFQVLQAFQGGFYVRATAQNAVIAHQVGVLVRPDGLFQLACQPAGTGRRITHQLNPPPQRLP